MLLSYVNVFLNLYWACRAYRVDSNLVCLLPLRSFGNLVSNVSVCSGPSGIRDNCFFSRAVNFGSVAFRSHRTVLPVFRLPDHVHSFLLVYSCFTFAEVSQPVRSENGKVAITEIGNGAR